MVGALAVVIMGSSAAHQAQAGNCVRYARALTHFDIRGDAWMWWQASAGRYDRGVRPTVGSVLVFKRTARLHRGHVSVVSRVIDRRTIEVDHSWLNGRGLRRGMQVIDTSPRNDWSSVRVWHEEIDQLGERVYPTYGFILPGRAPAGDEAEMRSAALEDNNQAAETATPTTTTVADAASAAADVDDEAAPQVTPTRRNGSHHSAYHTTIRLASLKETHGESRGASNSRSESRHHGHNFSLALAHGVQPAHKPGAHNDFAANLKPGHKPGTEVASVSPRRKPGSQLPPQVAELPSGHH